MHFHFRNVNGSDVHFAVACLIRGMIDAVCFVVAIFAVAFVTVVGCLRRHLIDLSRARNFIHIRFFACRNDSEVIGLKHAVKLSSFGLQFFVGLTLIFWSSYKICIL